MSVSKTILSTLLLAFINLPLSAQVVINEGSNKNYSAIADEDGDYPDWIELYNAGYATIDLSNYSLTDNLSEPRKWILPPVNLEPGQFKTVFCSGKDRNPVTGFTNVITTSAYTPVVGWNTHIFTTPFYWDGTSNILINTCSYSSTGYTSNSVFRQSATPFLSTVFAVQDNSSIACSYSYGNAVYQRPNMKINGHVVGTGTLQNSPYDYPAPYGNWYWGAKNQMLILASELSEVGLTAGYISSMAFRVVSTDPNTVYDYIDINMKLVTLPSVSYHFETVDPNNTLHTNFKISNDGETIYLYSPIQTLLCSLYVNCTNLDNSNGYSPDGSNNAFLFRTATPSSTNNASTTYSAYLLPPTYTVASGIYNSIFNVGIGNPNGGTSVIHYTTDGSEPSSLSPIYNDVPVPVFASTVLKASVSAEEYLSSPVTVASYLINVSHSTPILSVATDNSNLYGTTGIFDNWWLDWKKPAYIEYFDSTNQLVFSQHAAMQMDGGAGGSRSQPQHSFRLDPDHSVLGDGPINYNLIPDRPNRTKYSQFYLRNGSNQYLVLPYKDAAAVKAMGSGTFNYYSAWRPVSVYINGGYFGLYELREKFDKEYFHTLEGANASILDILSLSYWYGGVLRPVEGSVDAFWTSYNTFNSLEPSDTAYWQQADQIFDLTWYSDYIIAETWISNTDWPWNNIKIYRSDVTGYRWRFCIIDMELALAPNGWTDYTSDNIQFLFNIGPGNPYINIWLKSIQNGKFKNYFINRYADVMNTAYLNGAILGYEENMFSLTKNEMQNEFARWGDPNNVLGQMMGFVQNHIIYKSQLSLRTEQVRSQIVSDFGLLNQVDVTLDVDPPGAGTIHISTITPDTYPWQGKYFNGIPVKIEAIPAQGYAFLHWGDNSLILDTLNPVFNDTLNTTETDFKAYFINTVSIGPMVEASDFSIYPNPATDNLYVVSKKNETCKNISYRIYDLNGQILQSGNLNIGNKEWLIDIRQLHPSLYLFRITCNNDVSGLFRFVKL